MTEVDFKNMKNVDLVQYAREQGHNVRGMSRDRILDLLTVKTPKSIALPDEEATLCAMRSCPNRIVVKVVGSVQTVLAPKEKTAREIAEECAGEKNLILADTPLKGSETLSEMSWQNLKDMARLNCISIYGKKRVQVEAEIKEKSNG